MWKRVVLSHLVLIVNESEKVEINNIPDEQRLEGRHLLMLKRITDIRPVVCIEILYIFIYVEPEDFCFPWESCNIRWHKLQTMSYFSSRKIVITDVTWLSLEVWQALFENTWLSVFIINALIIFLYCMWARYYLPCLIFEQIHLQNPVFIWDETVLLSYILT